MISKLLAYAGSGLLLTAAVATVLWAMQVARAQPQLPPPPPPVAAMAEQPGQPEQTGRRPRPAVYYEAIIQRPVFSPSRRPVAPMPAALEPEPETPAPAVSEPEPVAVPQLRLLGIIGNGSERSALISNQGGDPAWIGQGGSIAGWQIGSVGPDWIEITLDSQKIRIEMYEQ